MNATGTTTARTSAVGMGTVGPDARTSPAAVTPERRPGRVRLFLIALFGLLTISALAPAPAQAATPMAPAVAAAPSFSTATACFQTANTLYGTTYWNIYNRPVQLDVWLNGMAQQTQTYVPNTRGCLTIALVPGYYWRFRVYHHEGRTWYLGQTAWRTSVAGYNTDFGTLRLTSYSG